MAEIDWEAAKSGKRPIWRADGYPCRFLEKLKGGAYAVAIDINGREFAQAYQENGSLSDFPDEGFLRLIQKSEVIEFRKWVNVYADGVSGHFDSEAVALECARDDVIDTIPVTIRITGKIVIHGESE